SIGVEWITSMKLRLGTSMPSLSHWLTKTIATSEFAASAAAAPALVPSLNVTDAEGAFPLIAFSGDDGCQTAGAQQGGHGVPSVSAGPPTGVTWADPPPESTPMSACDPITAIFVSPGPFNGSTPLFF